MKKFMKFVRLKPSKILEILFFLLVMALTFYAVFSRNDLSEIISSVRLLNPFYLVCAVFSAIFFVCMEGFMIWYLLRLTEKQISLFRCFSYSFIGFFFSGITPSATGGQPAQLLAMKKDRIPIGSATLSLMTVAVLYKLVLVLIGLGLLLFWKTGLSAYLGRYMAFYYLGIFLNGFLVILLLLLMVHGNWMESLLLRIETFCIKIRLCRPSEQRKEAFRQLVTDYQETLRFLLKHKSKILFTALCTFFQRCSLFLLTWFIYRGFGLSGRTPPAHHGITGFCLYLGGHASPSRIPGNIRTHVYFRICPRFYEYLSGFLHVRDQRAQLLFSAGRRRMYRLLL